MEDFKIALLEILKQGKQWNKYKQRLKKFEELFVEQQRKILTSNKNEDSGVFNRTQSKMLNLIICLKRG